MISRLATAALAALLLLICSATPAHSQTLDPASAEALATTLEPFDGPPPATAQTIDIGGDPVEIDLNLA